MVSIIVVIILSYLIGSIPSSIIAGKVLKGIDIREHGSGNAGATNVYRVLGWKACAVVALADCGKAYVAVVYISQITVGAVPITSEMIQILAGLSAIIGNVWTVFAQFKGGKGALTVLGVFLGLAPVTVLICFATFIVLVLTTRYVSVGTITAAILLSTIMVIRKYWLLHSIGLPLLLFTFLLTALLLITHRSNIKRLMNGTENRFSRK